MAFHSKYDKSGKCWRQGAEGEQAFERTAKAQGYIVTKASVGEDRRHIDFWLEKNDLKLSVEVKSRKRVSRNGNVQSEFVWVEFSNVRGKPGWLKSEVSKIALELDNDFIIVNREDLLKLAESKVDLKTFVIKSSDALYKSYRRKDRPKEHVGIIKLSDVKTIPHELWKKPIRL